MHGPLQVLDERSAFDEASKQYTVTPIPAQFTIKSSSIPNAGNGVFAKQFIPKGTRMGPYQGNPVPKDDMDRLCNTSYLWEVSIRVSIQQNNNHYDCRSTYWYHAALNAHVKVPGNERSYNHNLGKILHQDCFRILRLKIFLHHFSHTHRLKKATRKLFMSMGVIQACQTGYDM